MIATHHAVATAPVSPALVAAALDCLAFLPDGHRLEPSLLMEVTRTITADQSQAAALLVRIRATANILRDPRWPAWAMYYRASTPSQHRAFDAVMLDCVATLPLDAALRFSADAFFEALLGGMPLFVSN
jgi:hypothetical protein